MKNYIVAFELPRSVDQKVRGAFENTFNRDLPISNLHITLLPPFSLQSIDLSELKKRVYKVALDPPIVVLGMPGVFRNKDKNNLFMKVQSESLEGYYKRLKTSLKSVIKFDTSMYESNTLPPFLPHLSLDYDFAVKENSYSSIEKFIPKNAFKLLGPEIYGQRNKDVWEKVSIVF